jgi:hypothetical protein
MASWALCCAGQERTVRPVIVAHTGPSPRLLGCRPGTLDLLTDDPTGAPVADLADK